MRKGVVVWVAMAAFLTAGAAWGADSNSLTVQASVTGTCKFTTASSTLDFGTLDPASGADVNGNATVQFWCTKGVTTDAITATNGAHWSGTKRQMLDPVSSELIAYTLNLTPDGAANAGPGSPRTLGISGTVLGTDYTGKTAGSYSDTVTLDIIP